MHVILPPIIITSKLCEKINYFHKIPPNHQIVTEIGLYVGMTNVSLLTFNYNFIRKIIFSNYYNNKIVYVRTYLPHRWAVNHGTIKLTYSFWIAIIILSNKNIKLNIFIECKCIA